jgi:ankyrin repeat protein
MKCLVRLLLVFSLCCNPHITVCVFAHKNKWDANKSDWTSLMRYAYAADSRKIDSSIKAGCNVNVQNVRGETALSVAVHQGNEAIVSQLLSYAADPNLSDTDGYTPLISACGLGNTAITKLLLLHGANPNKSLRNGYSALMFATSFGTIEMMQVLVSKGANVNAKRGVDGMTALGLAEYNSDKAKIEFLKSHGAGNNR